ncbi:hypothetical protein FQA39_LY18313 [Lamprigera yunnana]|nr:hypothetical protein FQA39_LY18313 [Lamprigera yunnana]
MFCTVTVPLIEEQQLRIILRNLTPFLQMHLALVDISNNNDLIRIGRKLETSRVMIDDYVPPPRRKGNFLLEPDLTCLDALNPTTTRGLIKSSGSTRRKSSYACKLDDSSPNLTFDTMWKPRQIGSNTLTFEMIEEKKILKIEDMSGNEVYLGWEAVSEVWSLESVLKYRLSYSSCSNFKYFYEDVIRAVAEMSEDVKINIYNIINRLSEISDDIYNLLKKMWMLYAQEHWTKAYDLKSTVKRLYEELGALEFDADHEAIYGMERYFTVQQCEELGDKYKIGRKDSLNHSLKLNTIFSSNFCRELSDRFSKGIEIWPNLKTAIAILNCLLARQLCFEDPSCSAILEIIPRVCGPELDGCGDFVSGGCRVLLNKNSVFLTVEEWKTFMGLELYLANQFFHDSIEIQYILEQSFKDDLSVRNISETGDISTNVKIYYNWDHNEGLSSSMTRTMSAAPAARNRKDFLNTITLYRDYQTCTFNQYEMENIFCLKPIIDYRFEVMQSRKLKEFYYNLVECVIVQISKRGEILRMAAVAVGDVNVALDEMQKHGRLRDIQANTKL